jgi:DNA-binding beta-propeller fold protein YncE
MGAKMSPLAGATKPRIIQTNFASNYIDIIDPATDKIVGEIKGIELNHGVAVTPDGSKIFISDETNISLDVADGRTFQLTNRIPLSEHPNNIYIGRDGRFVYVSIAGKQFPRTCRFTTLMSRRTANTRWPDRFEERQ